jgi:hypothetical protein
MPSPSGPSVRAIGPVFGVISMRALRREPQAGRIASGRRGSSPGGEVDDKRKRTRLAPAGTTVR